mgnify:CR=1 FL=1
MNKTVFIFVTGGVVSSLGKGITAASLGLLLKRRGFSVAIQKFDPYLNRDPGTMSPYQHGEVFVTEDGCETDLDLGHYERFIDQNVTQYSSVTSGMIYWEVLSKERQGDFLGNTVQIIPHITNAIQDRLVASLGDTHADVVLTEVGGTIGDMESLAFLEAIRQFQYNRKHQCFHIHMTLVPYIGTAGELKTKPTQHSVKELRGIGIHPDAIICRADRPLALDIKKKIALFCDVDVESVISAHNVDSVYSIPALLAQEKLDKVIAKKFNWPDKQAPLDDWQIYSQKPDATWRSVCIAIVGKYTALPDAYISVVEALKHASMQQQCRLKIKWVNADELDDASAVLANSDGILVPGGFGDRGLSGKLKAATYARVNKIPYFGLCLGLHVAVIEFAQHVLGWPQANSREFQENTQPLVIDLMAGQSDIATGGSMRLGAYAIRLKPDSLVHTAYQCDTISERHRHRYEFNTQYSDDFEAAGLTLSGKSMVKDLEIIEIVELADHPWYVGCQFHPEFKSRPNRPHPLFSAFIHASTPQVQA